MAKVEKFEDLQAWQKARTLVKRRRACAKTSLPSNGRR